MKIKNTPIAQLKAGPADGLKEREFVVYPSTWTRTPDDDGDVVAKGAFADDIAARKQAGEKLPGLFGHNMYDPDFFIAAALEEGEDDHGWWIHGMFDDHPKAERVYRLAKGRRLKQLSFAYDVLDESRIELENGERANELRKLHAWEFSFVLVGANRDTSVEAVKSSTDALAAYVNTLTWSLTKQHIDSLRTAQDAIGAVIAAADGTQDQEKTSGTPSGQAGADDETDTGKSSATGEEPSGSPSVRLAAQAHIYALAHGGAGRGSS